MSIDMQAKSHQERERKLKDEDLFDEEEDTQKDRYLTFRLADEDYAVGIEHVIEIVGMQHIAAIPDLPEFLKGVMNLRGKVIPVMDVRSRFSMPERAYDERTCVVIVDFAGTSLGLIVDTVKEVLDIPSGNVTPPPRIVRTESARFIKGIGRVGDGVKIILDVERLLLEDEKAILTDLEPAEHQQN